MGVSVVNALSEKLDLTIYRDQRVFCFFREWKDSKTIKFLKKTKKSGTKINFYPRKKHFHQ